MKLDHLTNWYKGAAIFLMLSGLLITLAASPATSGLTGIILDILVWPFDGVQTLDATETRLVSAIGGGVMIGWGVAIWILANEGFKQAPELSRKIILASVSIWFVADSTASIAAGVPLNALSNTVYLAIFVLPLWNVRALSTAHTG